MFVMKIEGMKQERREWMDCRDEKSKGKDPSEGREREENRGEVRHEWGSEE